MLQHTILVVDDEPASVRTLARALADEHRVLTATTAADGLAALAAATHGPVALLIVDQRMPGMTGTELLARSMETHPDAIRILLTGYMGLETLVDAINAGHVYHYLSKPWEPRELRLVVRRGLERYEAEIERQRLLREVERACVRLQREADQKGRLLALASHEMGTPLHILANALAFIPATALPPAERPWLDSAQRSVDWLGRCLAQMRTAARWRSAGLKLARAALAVDALLQGVVSIYAGVSAERHLEMRLDASAAVPAIHGDPLWLRRALSNLVSNAIRFTPDGGRITVGAAATSAGVAIAVADTGVGIDARLLDELFEPFSAAGGDPALHTSGRFEFGARGLGLGLAITQAIVQAHGGSLEVQTQVGVGSRFTVTLPRAPAAAAGGAAAGAVPG
jgi:signal transduction histidine kinase